ncbi:MAG: rhodanese-like domain-containing protein [Spirochaetaceae bacterium]
MTITTTNELVKNLDKSNVKIIDIRPVEGYNGWIIGGEIRGGHIKTARSLPFKFFEYIELAEIINKKGIVKEDHLIIYGDNSKQTLLAGNLLIKEGFKKVIIYNDFENEWSSDLKLPMEKLSRYKHLVSANWLNNLIKNSTKNSSKIVTCHCHFDNPSDYNNGHIPGAIELDSNTLESTVTWNIKRPKELKESLELLGITYDSTVILYGRGFYSYDNKPFTGSSGGYLAAFRCALIMMYAGVEDVRILNGGFESWEYEDFEIETIKNSIEPVFDFGITIPGNPNLVVDKNEVEDIVNSDHKNLVSIRSWKEYIGEVSGYNYITKKGRIPGSIFGNCGTDTFHMENYRNIDNTTREYHEIKEFWEKLGICSDKFNTFYCGTGWRGSEAFLNAWLMGWSDISVYDGGWFEWSSDNKNRYETGIPQKIGV